MARSMTGYGAAQAAGDRIAVEVEARSVNARNLKLSLRTPPFLSPREADLDQLVRRSVRRGSVTLHVRVQFLRPDDTLRVRTEVVEAFARSLKKLRRKGLVESGLTAEAIAGLQGAIETGPEKALRPADWRVVRSAVQEALAGLDEMRQREARHLARELTAIVKRTRKTLAGIRKRSPVVVREYARKLNERIGALLANGGGTAVDQATLAREVALFADRSDITEELTRLQAHLDQFEGYLGRDQDVGRTLDFLSQELLREANTIGSKSSDVEIARHVITLKSDIDRLKEQVANLE